MFLAVIYLAILKYVFKGKKPYLWVNTSTLQIITVTVPPCKTEHMRIWGKQSSSLAPTTRSLRFLVFQSTILCREVIWDSPHSEISPHLWYWEGRGEKYEEVLKMGLVIRKSSLELLIGLSHYCSFQPKQDLLPRPR